MVSSPGEPVPLVEPLHAVVGEALCRRFGLVVGPLAEPAELIVFALAI